MSGNFSRTAAIRYSQNGDRFGVRIVDPENSHAVLGPEEDDARHLVPELPPVFAAKIQRINVLIFFRRIFSVFDRAIGAFVEPLGMLPT